MGGRGVTDWLRQKRGRNNTIKFEKEKQGEVYEKKLGVLPLCQNKSQKKD